MAKSQETNRKRKRPLLVGGIGKLAGGESAYLVIDAEDDVDAHQLREAIVQQTAIDGDRITIHGGGRP